MLTRFNGSKPSSAPTGVPLPSSAQAVPSIAVLPAAPPAAAAGPPVISVIESDSDTDVQSFTIPFRSAFSSTFLPMISVEDTWMTELEFRLKKATY